MRTVSLVVVLGLVGACSGSDFEAGIAAVGAGSSVGGSGGRGGEASSVSTSGDGGATSSTGAAGNAGRGGGAADGGGGVGTAGAGDGGRGGSSCSRASCPDGCCVNDVCEPKSGECDDCNPCTEDKYCGNECAHLMDQTVVNQVPVCPCTMDSDCETGNVLIDSFCGPTGVCGFISGGCPPP